MYCSAEMSACACHCSLLRDRKRNISNLNICTHAFQSIGIENELALRAVKLVVLLEAIGGGSGHGVDAVDVWGKYGFCYKMMRIWSRV